MVSVLHPLESPHCRPGIRRHIGSETDIPVARRPGCPHRSHRSLLTGGPPTTCCGSKPRSPSATPTRPPTSSTTWIAAAKATLGDRLFILGHHYQRDEVMRWADARGDSYRLSVLAQERPEAEYIVFCGVHFMAESADILTGDHQQVILPDLNAGCSMADMADIDQVEEAWEELGRVTDIDRLVPDHLHELVGRAQGVRRRARRRRVHLHQRPRGPRVGLPPRPRRRRRRQVLFFPDQHLGRNTGYRDGLHRRRHAGLEPAPRPRRPRPTRGQGVHLPALEGPLLGAPALPAGARRGLPGRAPRRHRHRPPRVRPRGVLESPTRSGRPTTSSRRSRPRPPGRPSPSAPRSTS